MSKITTDNFVDLIDFEPIFRVKQFIRKNGAMTGKKINKIRDNEPTFITIDSLFNFLKNGDDKIVDYAFGMFLYCGKLFKDKIKWDYDIYYSIGGAFSLNMNKVVENRVCPGFMREFFEDFWLKPFLSFEDYLRLCASKDWLNFNLDSALFVYRLQGDDAIPNILGQVFSDFDEEFAILPDKNVDCFVPEIDKCISGTFFPCLVTPEPDKMRSRTVKGAIFLEGLFNNKWKVLDIYCVGNFPIYNRSLSERMAFFGAGGETVESYVCYNYLDIIEASQKIKTNCLIRNLRENLLINSWFRWGLDSHICVRIKNKRIYGYNGSTNIKFDNLLKNEKKNTFLKISMNGNRIDKCTERDVIYSKDEILDFIELIQYSFS